MSNATTLKKLDACKKKKCSKTMKLNKKLKKSFEKEQAKACRQKNDMKFYKCSKRFYDKSEMKKLDDKHRECAEKKCSKEKKNLDKVRGVLF